MSTSNVGYHNKKRKKPVKFTPILRGVTQTPLDMQEDWMARLQYQKLKDTIVDGALRGWSSNIHGLHPIPALAYGSEFGQPEKGTPGTTEFRVGY